MKPLLTFVWVHFNCYNPKLVSPQQQSLLTPSQNCGLIFINLDLNNKHYPEMGCFTDEHLCALAAWPKRLKSENRVNQSVFLTPSDLIELNNWCLQTSYSACSPSFTSLPCQSKPCHFFSPLLHCAIILSL